MGISANEDDAGATMCVPLLPTAESAGIRPSLSVKRLRIPSIPVMIASLIPAALASLIPLPSAIPIDDKPEVPGYELLRIIGRGGEGTVWEALEKKLERRVAIKVHGRIRDGERESSTNLWTEAKVAARIGDPSIVTVLDVGLTLDARRYYAMELVRGTDLADLISRGPLPPRRAMEIAAEVARAVAAAHAHGVIHRDLKPRNVIVDAGNRARVLDFGIALDLRSGGDQLAGMLAGSPKYMAPEQIRGDAITPATDIWAIGVLLFEMLTSRSPFERPTMLDILDAIVSAAPEKPSMLVPGIHRDLDAIVKRCLSARPQDRFPNASALHEHIRAVLEGQSIEIARTDDTFSYQPRASYDAVENERPLRADADKHLSWTWELQSSPKDLWPHISDTQRFNEAVGLEPMAITTETGPDGRRIHHGSQKTLGLELSWQEFPFEWIALREHSKFRWYSQGPVKAIWNRVTFKPLENGGTELTHEIWVMTRGVLGKLASFVELDQRLARAVDRYYRQLDKLLVEGEDGEAVAANEPSRSQRACIAESAAQLLAQGFDERIVRALENRLLYAPDTALSPLRPYELADRWNTSREETVDALMHAAGHGVLIPTWNLLCPICRVPAMAVDSLAAVDERSQCPTCAEPFANDLERSVELVFVPAPEVRVASDETYCFGPPARRPHIQAQKLLAPRDEFVLALDLEPGAYKIIADHSKAAFELLVTATGFADKARLTFDGTCFDGGPAVVRAGRVELRLRNKSPSEEYFRIEGAEKLRSVFSAAAALTHPTFRELFATQLPMIGACLPVRELAFVFVRASCRELVAKLGDARACVELSKLGDRIADEARRFQGTVVPSSLSGVTIAFSSDAQAVRAALAMRTMLDQGFPAGVSVAIHTGGCISTSRSGRLEFFGETLQRGEAMVDACPTGAISVSDTLMANRKVALLVYESGRAAKGGQRAPGYADLRMTLLGSGHAA